MTAKRRQLEKVLLSGNKQCRLIIEAASVL